MVGIRDGEADLHPDADEYERGLLDAFGASSEMAENAFTHPMGSVGGQPRLKPCTAAFLASVRL